jgi:hypothetical protein
MKILRTKPKTQQGSTLAITLILCGILTFVLGYYFSMIESQHRMVARSQSWNEAMTVAEGGVEEALALINSGVQTPPSLAAIFPWKSASSGVYTNDATRPGSKFGTSYYEVSINNWVAGGTNLVIVSRGNVLGPIGSPNLARIVRVGLQARLTFPVKGPMIVEQSYNANGYNVGTDSFNSTNGPYSPSTAGTNGDIVSLTTNANAVVIGNGKIQGSVRTPTGGVQGVTATVGSNGSVGDAACVAGSTGFESGHFRPDFNLPDFPDATLPNVTFLPPMGGTAPNGLKYDYLLPGGNYTISSLSGAIYVSATNTILYVTGSINISGNAKNGWGAPGIEIAPGASLTLYMGGATTSISGNGIMNDANVASAFQYYGLPSNTSIALTGNGAFFGTIYAPEADFTLKGSGKQNTDDFTGASITKTTTMTGNFNFHYDEALGQLTTLGGYDPVSWAEL